MLTGFTSALRSLSVLSCGRHPIALTRLPHSTMTTLHYPQSMLKERIGAKNHAVTSSYERSTLAVPANGTPYISRASAFVGINGSSLNAQDLQQQKRIPRHKTLHCTKRKCPSQKRRTLLWVMLTTKSPDRAWAAYRDLLLHQVIIPRHLLHQLVRLLATIKPRTRTVHLQLLSVLKTLQGNRGQLRLWEWNTLIDSAGKHWHKTRLEDYEHALDIFNMKGILFRGNTAVVDGAAPDTEVDSSTAQQEPDIWTYNILLSIASRSNSPIAIRHASSLLLASGLSPNRYTHLCLLRYFAFRKDLCGVRSTLRKMKQQGLEVGLDGINACLWAYARNGRFDVAFPIYRVLRNNLELTRNTEGRSIEEDAHYTRNTIGLDIPRGFEPDEITYTLMIQTLAYHGDLKHALSVFVDMLSTPNKEAGVSAHSGTITVESMCYKPSMAAFRGLFLGFARHGQGPEHRTTEAEPIAAPLSSSQVVWDQVVLETVFAAFLQLPSLPKPTERLLYWILIAFEKTSGNTPATLREVWTKLETKYGGGWGGRLEEIKRTIFIDSNDRDAQAR